ncbi:MAG TPA: MmoB/DmpM family protein, partial [Kribbella sp.]
GTGVLDFDYAELTDALGSEFDGSVFEEISSTHYGRMVHLDERTLLFASPEDAAEYIGFDLTAH